MRPLLKIFVIVTLLLGYGEAGFCQILYSGQKFLRAETYKEYVPLSDYYYSDTAQIRPSLMYPFTDTIDGECKKIPGTGADPDTFLIAGIRITGSLVTGTSHYSKNGGTASYVEIEKADPDSLICLYRFISYALIVEPRPGGGHQTIPTWYVNTGKIVMHAVSSGVSSPQPLKLRYYPNPVQDVLTIQLDEPDPCEVTIYATDGKVISRTKVDPTNVIALDASSFTSGNYLIQVAGKNGITNFKFCKL